MTTLRTPVQIQTEILDRVAAGWREWTETRPGRVTLMRGGEVDVIECCSGFLGVSLDRIFPTETFPGPLEAPIPCANRRWAGEFTVYHSQCTVAAIVGNGLQPAFPTVEQVAESQMMLMTTAGAVLRAAADLIGEWQATYERAALLGEWLPNDVEGTCIGGHVSLTVELDLPWALS